MDRVNEVLAPTDEPRHESERATEYESLALQPGPSDTVPQLESIDVAWLLWEERRFLVKLTAAGLIAFTLLAFLLQKRYTATTQLMPPDFNTTSSMLMALPALSSSGDSSGGAASGSSLMGLAGKLLGFNSSGDLFIGVLRSRTIEDDIIKRFGLMQLYSVRYPEDARKMLERATEIKTDQKTGILSLAVEDKDPVRAAGIAQAYVEDLNQVLASVTNSSAHRERVFIEQRQSEVKKELDADAREFAEFASQNAALDIPEQAKAEVSAAADLQAQLIGAQSLLNGLEQIYTADNYRVRQMKAQVAELERQVNKLGGKGVTPANGSVLSGDELYPSIRQLPLLGVRYLDLFRRNKIDEAVYEFLTKQYEIARVEEVRDVPTAQILDAAVVPQKKTSPHRFFIMLGGMCFSFASGVSWILGRDRWKRTSSQSPWKVLIQEIAIVCKAATWDSSFGIRMRAMGNKLKRSYFRRDRPADVGAPD